MTISDPRIWHGHNKEIQPPEDIAKSGFGGAFPASRRRVVFAYWLAAIILGGAIWTGIAIAAGVA
jgi:hypothetical protein